MIGYLLLSMTLLLTSVSTPGVHGESEPFVPHPSLTCRQYFNLLELFTGCRNISHSLDINVDTVYQAVTDLCRDEEAIRSCMIDNVQHCVNLDEIRATMDNTFQFCQPYGVPFPMKSFLVANQGNIVTRECIDVLAREADSTCIAEEGPDLPFLETLEQQMERMSSRYKWYVDCFLTKNLTESIPECNNMIRGNVYGIMIAGLQFYVNFGFDYNQYFEYFLEES